MQPSRQTGYHAYQRCDSTGPSCAAAICRGVRPLSGTGDPNWRRFDALQIGPRLTKVAGPIRALGPVVIRGSVSLTVARRSVRIHEPLAIARVGARHQSRRRANPARGRSRPCRGAGRRWSAVRGGVGPRPVGAPVRVEASIIFLPAGRSIIGQSAWMTMWRAHVKHVYPELTDNGTGDLRNCAGEGRCDRRIQRQVSTTACELAIAVCTIAGQESGPLGSIATGGELCGVDGRNRVWS